MKFVVLFVLVAVLAAKIAYDVRKHANKNVYIVHVNTKYVDAYFFTPRKEICKEIAVYWQQQNAAVECGVMASKEAKIMQVIYVKACNYELHRGVHNTQMMVLDTTPSKTVR